MKISNKTDYALRTLFFLADNYSAGPVPISELARKNVVPKRFLEHILLDLKSQGWVSSRPGKNGGYQLSKRPDQISMGKVVRLFDGLLAPIHCVSINRYRPCPLESRCRFRYVFLQVRNQTAESMDRATLASVVACSDRGRKRKPETTMLRKRNHEGLTLAKKPRHSVKYRKTKKP
jgi:Rrf2 family protein